MHVLNPTILFACECDKQCWGNIEHKETILIFSENWYAFDCMVINSRGSIMIDKFHVISHFIFLNKITHRNQIQQ